MRGVAYSGKARKKERQKDYSVPVAGAERERNNFTLKLSRLKIVE